MKRLILILLLSPALLGSRTFETIDLILDLARSREAVRELARAVDLGSVPSIAPAPGRISSRFGSRVHPVWRCRSFHSGLDIANAEGTPVCAVGGGVVVFAGGGRRYSGYGNVVVIEHSPRVRTMVAHLGAVFVAEGDRVRRGDVVGTIGSTGISTGPHVHYEIIVEGIHVDPEAWIL